jgi:hypothetical protein
VVYLDEQRGAGLELIGFSTAMRAQLAELWSVAPGPADDDGASAAPEPPDRDDEYRTLPVPIGARAASVAEPDADDDLAVPIEDADDRHTAPVWTRSRARRPDDRGAPPSVSGVARPPRTSVFGHSDPAFAIGIEADAAFSDGAELDAEEIDAADPARDRPAPHDAGAPQPMPDGMDATTEAVADPDPEAGPQDGEADGELGHAADSPARAPRHVHERLRGLTLAAQNKLAASGELHERIVLERLYGKNVWETLLRNPRLTPPEVSRIARYGSLPRVLLEIILGNATWLQVPEVRRALLANPRLGTDQVLKVLRLTPRHELRIAAIQTAYPHAVRQAAKLLLGGE